MSPVDNRTPRRRRGRAATAAGAICLALVVLGASPLPAAAQDDAGVTFPPKPPRQHFFVDEAGLVDGATGAAVDRIAEGLLRDQDVALVVVTLSSLGAHGADGWTIERYARALFDHWGIGSRERNYGMLLLVSKGDRRARIELGASWGGTHDAEARQVMDDLVIPEFKRGDYAGGILAGVRGLDAMARGLALPRPKRPWWKPLLVLGLLVLGIGVAISLMRSGRKGWGWALLAVIGVVLFFIIRAAMSGRGSGGAFGGGFSGGGGASGSW